MKFFLLFTTLISSGLAFLPALFSLENFIKSSACHNDNTHAYDNLVTLVSQSHRHNVSGLHGSWRQLRPKDAGGTVYQTIDFEKKFALATTLFSNGTRVESVMPFETCRGFHQMYFTHAKQFTTFKDDSRFTRNVTCSDQSFELLYASPSLRVDRMMADETYRVLVPCEHVYLKL